MAKCDVCGKEAGDMIFKGTCWGCSGKAYRSKLLEEIEKKLGEVQHLITKLTHQEGKEYMDKGCEINDKVVELRNQLLRDNLVNK
jgi:hypothetical protein